MRGKPTQSRVSRPGNDVQIPTDDRWKIRPRCRSRVSIMWALRRLYWSFNCYHFFSENFYKTRE